MNTIGKLLEFQSPAFPPDADDEELVNSHCMHGHALATYIGGKIVNHGFKVKRYVAEDWGWYCEVENPEFELWYGVSAMDEDRFLIQFCPNKPTIRRWFKKIDVSDRLTSLQHAVLKVLKETDSRVADPQWTDG